MGIVALDHVQLAMPTGQEDRARAFYRDILGLPEQAKPANLAARGGCWFATDNLRIHLGIDPEFKPAGKAHPAFLVDDLDALRKRLVSAAFPVVEDEPLEGYERCYTYDPFGNRIELMQPVEP
jgi:catechol 2,3-dioxygenase-like lactoylglutathione lyase family enzyme